MKRPKRDVHCILLLNVIWNSGVWKYTRVHDWVIEHNFFILQDGFTRVLVFHRSLDANMGNPIQSLHMLYLLEPVFLNLLSYSRFCNSNISQNFLLLYGSFSTANNTLESVGFPVLLQSMQPSIWHFAQTFFVGHWTQPSVQTLSSLQRAGWSIVPGWCGI